MNATSNKELLSGETHQNTSHSFLNIASLPKKKKETLKRKKEIAHSEVLTSVQRKLSWKK
jgi:hypothetical protein